MSHPLKVLEGTIVYRDTSPKPASGAPGTRRLLLLQLGEGRLDAEVSIGLAQATHGLKKRAFDIAVVIDRGEERVIKA